MKLLNNSIVRSIKKEKLFSAILILGLATGLSTLALILNYFKVVYSYDTYHKDSDKIYKLIINDRKNNQVNEIGLAKYSEKIKSLNGVDAATKIFKNGLTEIKVSKNKFIEQTIFSDSDFFKVFTHKFIKGNNHGILDKPFEVVLSESAAKRMLGSADVINKSIKIDDQEYFVKAVFEDVPANSHFRFDVVLSFSSWNSFFDRCMNEFYTYFRINNHAADVSVLNNVKQECRNVFLPYAEKGFTNVDYILMPLKDVYHKSSAFQFKIAEYANDNHIKILMVIGGCIFLIMTLNFINLLTVYFQKRLKEFAIKKILGAGTKTISMQLISESAIFSLLGTAVGLIITALLLTQFSELLNLNPDLFYNEFYSTALFFIISGLLLGVLSAIYPIIRLRRENKSTALIKEIHYSKKTKFMYAVVFVQFFVVSGLLTGLFVITDQVNYMKNKDLGFNKDQIIFFPNESKANYDAVIPELNKIKGVKLVGASQSLPGGLHNGMTLCRFGADKSQTFNSFENRIQKGFISTYGLKLIAGRDFEYSNDSEKDNIILNETAVKKLGYTPGEIVSKKVIHLHGPKVVIGVVKDYHFMSLHSKIEPLILSNYSAYAGYYSLLINTADYKTLFANINTVIKRIDSEFKPEITFLNDKINQLYISDSQESALIIISTVLCIVLSIVGLVALTAFIILRRTKEISIRKVLGASVPGLLVELSKIFFWMVLVSNLIVLPVVMPLLRDWLNNYSYRINLGTDYFVYTFFTLLIITLVSIAYFIIKAALRNPLENLKYE